MVASLAVWSFAPFTVAWWAFETGPARLLAIVWAIVTIAALVFALTGWPCKRQRFGFLLVGRVVAGLCVLWLGGWSFLASSAFDPRRRLVAIPTGTLAIAALLFATTGWPFKWRESRHRLTGPPPSEGASL
jgi:O-antigen/teichoic acid export membrane protein